MKEKEDKLKYERQYIEKLDELGRAMREIERLKNTVDKLETNTLNQQILADHAAKNERIIELQREVSFLTDKLNKLQIQHQRDLTVLRNDLEEQYSQKLHDQKMKLGNEILDAKQDSLKERNLNILIDRENQILKSNLSDLKQEIDRYKQQYQTYYEEVVQLRGELKYEQLDNSNLFSFFILYRQTH